MALNMGNASHARNVTGRKTLLTDLRGDIERARKRLTGSDYQQLVRTVQNNWVGPDADKFLKMFNSSVNEIANTMKQYEATIEKALAADANQFAKFQQTNASAINKQ